MAACAEAARFSCNSRAARTLIVCRARNRTAVALADCESPLSSLCRRAAAAFPANDAGAPALRVADTNGTAVLDGRRARTRATVDPRSPKKQLAESSDLIRTGFTADTPDTPHAGVAGKGRSLPNADA